MKKLVGLLAISAIAVSAFAQGTFAPGNSGTSLVRQWTSASDQTLISTPVNGAQITLIAAPAGTALTSLGTLGASGFAPTYTSLAGFLAANPGWVAYNTMSITPVPGRFSGATQTITPLTPGGNISYIVIGWTAAGTLDNALSTRTGMAGQSAVFTSTTGNPTITPAGTPTPMNGTFGGLTMGQIVAVPEPTSLALAGLGLAALLAFRRRN